MADIWVNILGDGSKLKGELDKSSKNVTSFSEKIGKIGKIATVAGAAVTGAFAAIVIKTAQAGDEFDKMSLRTGVAVEDLSGLSYASSICGSSIETLENSLRFMARGIYDTSMGVGEAKDVFEKLDVSVVNADGSLRSSMPVLKEIATKIAAMTNETEQAAYAGKIFGTRYGTQLMPLLKLGASGIEELMEKAKELGITMTTEAATAAAEFTDRMTDLKGSLAGAGRMIGDTLIPAITPLIEKATEIVVKIKEWAEENSELVEKIFKWAAALGVTLAVLGPILVILPSLITGVTLLSGAFLPFAATGAIVLGIMKLSEYLRETVGGMREFRGELGKMELDAVDAEIQELTDSLEQMQKKFYEIPEGFFGRKRELSEQGQMILTMMDEMNKRLEMLYKRREELTKAEEEGIDVTKEKIKLDEEVKELLETLAQKEEEAKKALEEKAKAAELANAQTEIGNKIYALTHTAMEVAIRDLDLLKQAYLDKGIALEDVDKWHELEIKRLEELNEKQKENIGIMEEVARVTKTVTDRIYELIHTPYEVKLKNINEEYDGYIEIVKEAKLSLEAEKTAIDNINIARDLEIKGLDELIKKEEEGIDQKNKLANAYKTITDKIYELTHTPMETMIKRLEEERQGYLDLGISIELADELFSLQILKLEEVGDAFITLDNTVKPVITAITGYLETQLAGAISNLLSQTEDFEWSWSAFWEGLKNTLINAVSAMIAKLIVLAAFKWLFPWLNIGWEKGGGVGYDFGGQVKKFQFGGVADTIPARLTVGEYVIAKPMTDFIKRFRAIPQNLIDAVASGMPTPIPAFAGGGPVSTSNISRTDFGETKIYIDIHDNRISDEVDIRKLSAAVSDEIVRRLNQRRRF